ncbi:hypothetical protein SNEBB_005604 [Seison nebaliae]|nr:hypothetical protein SNEBB_005604 [Seison nebaliae]
MDSEEEISTINTEVRNKRFLKKKDRRNSILFFNNSTSPDDDSELSMDENTIPHSKTFPVNVNNCDMIEEVSELDENDRKLSFNRKRKRTKENQMEETEKQANTRDDVINNLEQNNKNLQQKLLAQRAQSELEKVNSLQMLDKLYQEMQEMKIAHKESWMRSKSNARTDSTTDADERVQQLEAEVYYLKSETRHLKETNENLSAQLMVRSMEEGKLLLQVGNNEVMSLAAEFEQLSKDELMEKLRESQALNMRYREYIDRMLLRILETCPSLLEIKGLGNDLPPIPTAESVRSSMRAKPKVEQTKSSLAKRLSFSSIKSTLAAGMLPPSVNTPSISESIVSESIEEVQDETLY